MTDWCRSGLSGVSNLVGSRICTILDPNFGEDPFPRRWVNRRHVAALRAEAVLAVLHHGGGGGVLLGEVRAAGYRLQARTGYGLAQPSVPLQGYPPVLLAPQDRHGPFYAP